MNAYAAVPGVGVKPLDSQHVTIDSKRKYYDEQLVSKYPDVYKHLIKKTRNSAVSEDITQDVFLRAWERFEQYDHILNHPKGWLFRIADNLLIDYCRKRKCIVSAQNRVVSEAKQKHDEKEQAIERDITERAEWGGSFKSFEKNLWGALYPDVQLVHPNYRVAVILKYGFDFKVKEIAQMLNSNTNTILSNLSRGRNGIIQAIGGIEALIEEYRYREGLCIRLSVSN